MNLVICNFTGIRPSMVIYISLQYRVDVYATRTEIKYEPSFISYIKDYTCT